MFNKKNRLYRLINVEYISNITLKQYPMFIRDRKIFDMIIINSQLEHDHITAAAAAKTKMGEWEKHKRKSSPI
ncbi:hypothetical protein DERP_004326 [Dermatophagoides pteronyssinus]|uniref:Uncharacterized protein n=1 Tax=Dermatophagoides pteronyssinus TaxID=6956 RepID=A0ABQ8JNF5_DERPT|nr:hypothetical protein DERP_004326 [Dermatophagoides pteronyssinus]